MCILILVYLFLMKLEISLKILFTPNDIGGGFGHVSRCLAIAEYCKTVGVSTAFLMHHKSATDKIHDDFTVFSVPVKSIFQKYSEFIFNYLKPLPMPLFITVTDLSYQVIRDGFTSVNIVKKVINSYLDILNNYKPDIIINDTNLLIGIAAKILDIPLVQITRKAFYPGGSKLIWWEEKQNLIAPEVTILFNELLDFYNLSPVKKAEELLTGELYVVPSIPELEPDIQGKDTFYVGPLLKNERQNEEFVLNQNKRKNIYVTIGAGAVGHSQFFNLINKALGKTEYNIIVSCLGKYKNKPNEDSPNIHYYNWVLGRQVIRQSDLVIFHGGYGTMMETIEAGIPSLVVPFHSEQESNGRRLRENGCSELCKLSNQEDVIIKKEWNFGKYSYAIQNEFTLSNYELLAYIEKLLNDGSYQDNVKKLNEKLEMYEGPVKILSIIQDELSVI